MKHIYRQLTEEERQRHAQIQEAAYKDFPPSPKPSEEAIVKACEKARHIYISPETMRKILIAAYQIDFPIEFPSLSNTLSMPTKAKYS